MIKVTVFENTINLSKKHRIYFSFHQELTKILSKWKGYSLLPRGLRLTHRLSENSTPNPYSRFFQHFFDAFLDFLVCFINTFWMNCFATKNSKFQITHNKFVKPVWKKTPKLGLFFTTWKLSIWRGLFFTSKGFLHNFVTSMKTSFGS